LTLASAALLELAEADARPFRDGRGDERGAAVEGVVAPKLASGAPQRQRTPGTNSERRLSSSVNRAVSIASWPKEIERLG